MRTSDPWELRGHESYVYGLAVSADGSRIASGSWDKTIRLWDARTLRPGPVLRGHTADWVGSVAFSPDGKTLVSVDSDKRMIAWDVEAATKRLEMDDYAFFADAPIMFHRNRSLVVVGQRDRELDVFDFRTGEKSVEQLSFLRECRSTRINADGSRFVRFEAEADIPHQPTSSFVVLCETDTGRALARIEAGPGCRHVAFTGRAVTPERLLVPSGRPKANPPVWGWTIVDVRSGAIVKAVEDERSAIMAATYSTDGSRFTLRHPKRTGTGNAKRFDRTAIRPLPLEDPERLVEHLLGVERHTACRDMPTRPAAADFDFAAADVDPC